jgi:hypothetical protein
MGIVSCWRVERPQNNKYRELRLSRVKSTPQVLVNVLPSGLGASLGQNIRLVGSSGSMEAKVSLAGGKQPYWWVGPGEAVTSFLVAEGLSVLNTKVQVEIAGGVFRVLGCAG